MKASTPNPDEVQKHFLDYADILDTYASDQRASLRWNKSGRARYEVEARAKVYSDLASEIRAIEWIEGPIE